MHEVHLTKPLDLHHQACTCCSADSSSSIRALVTVWKVLQRVMKEIIIGVRDSLVVGSRRRKRPLSELTCVNQCMSSAICTSDS